MRLFDWEHISNKGFREKTFRLKEMILSSIGLSDESEIAPKTVERGIY